MTVVPNGRCQISGTISWEIESERRRTSHRPESSTGILRTGVYVSAFGGRPGTIRRQNTAVTLICARDHRLVSRGRTSQALPLGVREPRWACDMMPYVVRTPTAITSEAWERYFTSRQILFSTKVTGRSPPLPYGEACRRALTATTAKARPSEQRQVDAGKLVRQRLLHSALRNKPSRLNNHDHDHDHDHDTFGSSGRAVRFPDPDGSRTRWKSHRV